MFRIVVIGVVFTVVLSGCVQRATYNKTGKPVVKSQINQIKAARTRIALGLQYLKAGEMSSAKYNLEKAQIFAPKLPAVHTAFAYYYQKVNEDELAEKAYLKALSFDANDPDTLNNYGTFLCKVKQYDKAENKFLKAIKVPSYLQVAQSYENAALCAMENKQYDKAKLYFTHSLDHSALRPNTLVSTAGLSYAMGDYSDAQKYGTRLGNIGVASARVLLLRALTEMKLGNISQSKKYGTTLVSMYVKSPEALMYLSRSFENSEFEQLRRLYLKHQYQAFKQQQKDDRLNTSSKTKIKKTLKPQNASQSTDVTVVRQPTQQKTSVEQQIKITAPVPVVAKPVTVAEQVLQQGKPERIVVENIIKPILKQPVKQQLDSRVRADKKTIASVQVPFHIVTNGQGLYHVSMAYNIKMRRLLQWNNLTEQSGLSTGDKIYLKDPNIYHTVEKGDTLFGLSLKYNILLDKLLKWNDLNTNAQLIPGRRVLIVNPQRYFLH